VPPSERDRRAPTLRDVAALARVDVSTVSKVLSGQILVREETRARILGAVEELRYRPNAVARGLRMQRTGAIGMLFPGLNNPTYAAIVHGAISEAAELGYVVLVGEVPEDDFELPRRLATEQRVDGLIIASASRAAPSVLDGVPASLPYLYVNRRVEGAGRNIVIDDETAGSIAARALIDAGHETVGFLGAPEAIDTAHRRCNGFLEEFRSAGLAEPTIVSCAPTMRAGFAATTDLLALTARPTAVFASSVQIAKGLLAGLGAAGIDVPGDLSMLTVDAEEAEFARPPLTAVRLPFRELGVVAVREMHRILQGGEPRDVTIPEVPQLITRASVAEPTVR
jgi:LacI family transcriptional regulator